MYITNYVKSYGHYENTTDFRLSLGQKYITLNGKEKSLQTKIFSRLLQISSEVCKHAVELNKLCRYDYRIHIDKTL